MNTSIQSIKKISISLVVLLGAYWLCKEIYWRAFNCSTIKVEVSKNLDLHQVKVIASHRMGDATIFEDGKQVSATVSVFDEQPMFWDLVYSDTLYARFLSGDFKDYREDFDYKFSFYAKLDTLFCAYSRNNEPAKVIRLSARERK